MLLKIGQYEVELTAFNKIMDMEDTKLFLYELCAMAYDAMHLNEKDGYINIAEMDREWAGDIYKALHPEEV